MDKASFLTYLAYSINDGILKLKIGKSTADRNGTYKGSKTILKNTE
jgi:hypothetical protein